MIAVHAMTFVHQKGPVFYASLPCGPGATETLTGCRTNGQGDKRRLVSILWGHLAAIEGRDVFPIHLVRDPLGRPYLLLGEYRGPLKVGDFQGCIRGPAVSFSEGGGKVWAAFCEDGSEIGIDVAAAEEFQGDYPFHRVFHEQELQHALRMTDGDLEKASALLWSIKEAVVKALGCGFHLVGPRQIYIYPSTGGDGIYTFQVCLIGKAQVRFPIGPGRSIWARSLPKEKTWLSIACLNRQP